MKIAKRKRTYQTEAQLQSKCKKEAEKLGCIFRCIDYRRARNRYGGYVFGNTGCPDCLIITPEGDILFVELKNKYGQLRPSQKKEFGLFKKYGIDVYVIRHVSQLLRLVENIRGKNYV